MKYLRRFAIRKISLETLSHIVVVLGVPLFFYQQYQETLRNKVEQSVQYYHQFQDESFSEKKYILLEPWLRMNTQHIVTQGITQSAIDKMVRDVALSNPKVIRAIIEMSSFYESLNQCVSTDLCDKKVASALFSVEANKIRCIYRPVIEDIGKKLNRESFANGLYKIANAHNSKCEY